MISGLQIGIRLVFCLAITLIAITLLEIWFQVSIFSTEAFMPGPSLAACICLFAIWFLMLGLPFISWCSEQISSIWLPSSDDPDHQPDYSLAKTQVLEGHYQSAINLYQEYSRKFPREITPHIRIAELLIERFSKYDSAISELKRASRKAQRAEDFAAVQFRLAEVYISHFSDYRAALDCLHRVQRKYPNSRQYAAARERIQQIMGYHRPPIN